MNRNSSTHDGQVERSGIQQRCICAQPAAIIDQQSAHCLADDLRINQSRSASIVPWSTERAYRSRKLAKAWLQHDAASATSSSQSQACPAIGRNAPIAREVAGHDPNSTARTTAAVRNEPGCTVRRYSTVND